jgi:DNA-directed RNA polymerase subunit omega
MMNKLQFIQDQLAYEATLGLSNEAAVAAVENRYDLVLIGARRARELGRGDKPRIDGPKHGAVVTALKEIELGLVGRDYLYKQLDIEPRRRYKDHGSF